MSRFALAAVAAAVLGLPPAARADELLDKIAFVAADIAAFLKDKGESSAVLSVSGPLTFKSAGGSALTQLLGDKLKAKGVRAAEQANYGVKVDFNLEGPDGTGPKTVRFVATMQIVDKRGKAVSNSDYQVDVVDPRRAAELLGLTFPNTKPDDPGALNENVWNAFINPKPPAEGGTKARPGPDSPFAVEVLVGDRPRRIDAKDGLGFIGLDLDEEYEIRLTNGAAYEVAVAVAVDGLSTFHFSTEKRSDGSPRYNYFVVAPGKTQVVRGWETGPTTAKRFQVVPLADSLAAKLGRTDHIGMLTATFHASWEKGRGRPPADEPPSFGPDTGRPKFTFADEQRGDRKTRVVTPKYESVPVTSSIPLPASPKPAPTGGGAVGTGFGKEFTNPGVGVSRVIGTERGAVTLRYKRPG